MHTTFSRDLIIMRGQTSDTEAGNSSVDNGRMVCVFKMRVAKNVCVLKRISKQMEKD